MSGFEEYAKREDETEAEYMSRVETWAEQAVSGLLDDLVDPMAQAWASMYEMFAGLKKGGFGVGEAAMVCGSYLYVMSLGREDK